MVVLMEGPSVHHPQYLSPRFSVTMQHLDSQCDDELDVVNMCT